MLHWLRARNIALLRDVSIGFESGLNVISGETGAGKSLLFEALGLALGGRASGRLIGPHGERAVVEAGFSLPEGEPEACEAAGIPIGDGEVVVFRELRSGASGRSLVNRTTVNGAAVPVATLRAIGMELAEVYSQGEHLALVRPDAARETLDLLAGRLELREQVRGAFRRLRAAEAQRDAFAARLRETRDQRAGMEAALREIEAADPQPGETETLRAERRVLGEAERLTALLDTAYDALQGAESSAAARLAAASRALDEAAGFDDEVASLRDGRADLLVEIEDLAASVLGRRDAIRAGPERLAEIEERVALLRGLERRHAGGAGGAEALLARAAEIRKSLAELTDQSEAKRQAGAAAARETRRYLALAAELSEIRRGAAAELGERVERELAGLGIPEARFSVRFENPASGDSRPDDAASGDRMPGGAPAPGSPSWPPGSGCGNPESDTRRFSEHGLDRIEFLFSANRELPPAPIGQVASGGESSRFFLALKAAGARRGGSATLVFDEADAGTSGRIADAVGRRLARLAGSRQVVAVTHLPQVAALGSAHLVVEKLESGASVRVRSLRGTARIEEVARMLAGPEITESAREHARALLGGAKQPSARTRPSRAAP